ncbi:excalibur calcium-binding domain-containing protein [Streptomyces sp. APSN-46.1]|uniref:excalibur calcium-binding domain-containing protein n=1 Tax=Streptomyces sp. APSN-46.1 TaxID=2929049 RepID=UPI001FB3FCD9|nr:excalibur calcium-binding domain-containing protein [Streptomyces sp. APSN-46.1]MCJ1680492.1 excalibur calcium-binding domain-containing protein [Streptomyces sp. APSN-46.1]
MAGAIGAVILLSAGCEDTGTAPKNGASAAASGSASPSSPPGASAARPVMPQVVGERLLDATVLVKKVISAPAELVSAYGDVTLPADPMAWTVCFQTPASDSAVTPESAVELSLTAPGTACPERAGASLRPSKTPAPAPTPTLTRIPAPAKPPTAPKTPPPADGGGAVYFKNCDAAKAAGKAPLRRGQPGYRDALDRDKDGIACDRG